MAGRKRPQPRRILGARFAGGDAASCFLLVVSPESVKSANVRSEWERAKAQGQRILIVLRRRATLPKELVDCEVIDFRGAFTPALRGLIARLGADAHGRAGHFFWKLPPWILAIAITLVIPIADYFLLASWSDNSPKESAAFEIMLRLLLPVFALLLLWFLGFSFLRRRMGMTHLLACFAFTMAWTIYPLALFWLSGPEGLAGYATGMRQSITERPLEMELLGALPLAGLFVVLIIQPEELLRWTPTGRAWSWYRARSVAKGPGLEGVSALKTIDRYCLLHDPIDGPAADRLRKELEQTGAKEATSDGTRIVLLTSRTRAEWLLHNAKQLPEKVMTIVGTSIHLPEQFDWLWRREWIDFRHWDVKRLDHKKGLPAVPEAVTGTRFPQPVRMAHHLLCSMAALAMLLPPLADPNDSGQAPAVAILALLIWYGTLARRLLRRTISERAFYRAWPVGILFVAGLAAWSFHMAMARGVSLIQAAPMAAFLAAWPVLWVSNKGELAFWFPSAVVPSLKGALSLSTRRNWQTLLWISGYCLIWYLALGLYREAP
jgi:hypothetical protein